MCRSLNVPSAILLTEEPRLDLESIPMKKVMQRRCYVATTKALKIQRKHKIRLTSLTRAKWMMNASVLTIKLQIGILNNNRVSAQ